MHEGEPLQNANGINEVITIADLQHIQRWFERKVDPHVVQKEISISSVIVLQHQNTSVLGHTNVLPVHPQNLDDPEANKFSDVVGVIAEDLLLTQCAQVCFTGKEEDQAEQHDHGTIDEVLGDSDMERRPRS